MDEMEYVGKAKRMEGWDNYEIAFECYLQAGKICYNSQKIDYSIRHFGNGMRNLKRLLKVENRNISEKHLDSISEYLSEMVINEDVKTIGEVKKKMVHFNVLNPQKVDEIVKRIMDKQIRSPPPICGRET